MQTLFLDGSCYKSAEALHTALKKMLQLPEWYGMNADALYDCLSERREPIHLWIASDGEGSVADAMHKIRRVVEDLNGTVREL